MEDTIVVTNKKQLRAAMLLIDEGPLTIVLQREGGKTTYRFPKAYGNPRSPGMNTATRIKEVRKKIKNLPAEIFK